jgi:hypothetical protein
VPALPRFVTLQYVFSIYDFLPHCLPQRIFDEHLQAVHFHAKTRWESIEPVLLSDPAYRQLTLPPSQLEPTAVATDSETSAKQVSASAGSASSSSTSDEKVGDEMVVASIASAAPVVASSGASFHFLK